MMTMFEGAGGGIQSTVNASRNLEEEDLLRSLEERLERAVRQGTTLLEAKTGYGLSLDLEVKLLKVLHKASETISEKIELVSTYLGAHSVPPGKTSAEASEDIVRNHIPHLIELRRQNIISPSNIDVFLEKGVFGLEDTRSILQVLPFSFSFFLLIMFLIVVGKKGWKGCWSRD